MKQILIQKLVETEDLVVPVLFKPVQFNVLKKLDAGKKLTENEKRYLRGKMKGKLNILNIVSKFEAGSAAVGMAGKPEGLAGEPKDCIEYAAFLDSLESYYITGLEALKYNGFGWYFNVKITEVINTKIEGKVCISNRTVKFIRVKSIRKSKFSIDKKTGLKYAENRQIIKDIKITKNEYAKIVWEQMLSRYKRLFVKDYNRFKRKQSRGICFQGSKKSEDIEK